VDSQTQILSVEDSNTQDPFFMPMGRSQESEDNNQRHVSSINLKRERSSTEESTDFNSQRPSKKVNLDTRDIPNKENVSSNSVQVNRNINKSSDEDMFGFSSSISADKQVLPDSIAKKSEPLNLKRSRHVSDDDDDDIFGFEEAPKQKILREEKSCNNNKTNEDALVESLHVENTVDSSSSLEKTAENIKLNSNQSKPFNKSILDTTGFVGKEDILTVKSEIKTEEDETKLSVSLVKITLSNMYRPDTSRPRYVADPKPEHLGKPVINFKKFKKQTVEKSRIHIELNTYVPSDLNQTAIENWFNQNKDYAQKENEQTIIDQQSDDFWNFHSSQRKAINPFTRR